MTEGLGPSTAALQLTDVTSTMDLDLVWRDDQATPAVRAFLAVRAPAAGRGRLGMTDGLDAAIGA
ncbi:hypothetical protein ACIA74_44075 [Streptomyces sp. NPDC051658]|uniref:hypothetical protein n=1 Tax=Streptomyces sp. NPDC051658 TaxID=3365667 RepID=UPI0037AABC32